MVSKVTMLITATPADLATESGQRYVSNWLDMKKVNYRVIDAVLHKEERMKLTEISGIKGKFPQVFVESEDGKMEYIGGFEKIRDLIELNDVDPSILAKDPSVKTFDQVFDKCFVK